MATKLMVTERNVDMSDGMNLVIGTEAFPLLQPGIAWFVGAAAVRNFLRLVPT